MLLDVVLRNIALVARFGQVWFFVDISIHLRSYSSTVTFPCVSSCTGYWQNLFSSRTLHETEDKKLIISPSCSKRRHGYLDYRTEQHLVESNNAAFAPDKPSTSIPSKASRQLQVQIPYSSYETNHYAFMKVLWSPYTAVSTNTVTAHVLIDHHESVCGGGKAPALACWCPLGSRLLGICGWIVNGWVGCSFWAVLAG